MFMFIQPEPINLRYSFVPTQPHPNQHSSNAAAITANRSTPSKNGERRPPDFSLAYSVFVVVVVFFFNQINHIYVNLHVQHHRSTPTHVNSTRRGDDSTLRNRVKKKHTNVKSLMLAKLFNKRENKYRNCFRYAK